MDIANYINTAVINLIKGIRKGVAAIPAISRCLRFLTIFVISETEKCRKLSKIVKFERKIGASKIEELGIFLVIK